MKIGVGTECCANLTRNICSRKATEAEMLDWLWPANPMNACREQFLLGKKGSL